MWARARQAEARPGFSRHSAAGPVTHPSPPTLTPGVPLVEFADAAGDDATGLENGHRRKPTQFVFVCITVSKFQKTSIGTVEFAFKDVFATPSTHLKPNVSWFINFRFMDSSDMNYNQDSSADDGD
ncbi:hypothetical protein AAG570_009804 [Ranatra chinensis]|uniref:Uncharacterized protein n=1 Tax=Ranatra chinensis TaxID=642074 RepID=A0ABD0Z346_9HEMI